MATTALTDGLDDPYQFVLLVALTQRELDQLAGTGDHRAPIGRLHGYGYPAAPTELEKTFVPELSKGAQHRVGIDPEDSGQILGGGKSFAGLGLTVGNGSAEFSGNLLEQEHGTLRIDLDWQHHANHTSTMSDNRRTQAP